MEKLIESSCPSPADFSRSFFVAVLFSIAVAMAPDVGAQGKGGSGSSNGAVGGGASSAANRGGAGGVSNPNPGGDPNSAGGPAFSNGPQGTASSRAGYLGGRNAEPVTPQTTVATLAANQFSSCPIGRAPSSRSQARLSGENNERIGIVAQYLTQGRDESGSSARY
ncbi:MAG: hypothetical protein EBY29_10805, partial [Planctomycetes bacterium]|nr:hypothetical protein [Planctomycetota bacterium]